MRGGDHRRAQAHACWRDRRARRDVRSSSRAPPAPAQRGLADRDQGESRVVELAEQVLDRTARGEHEPKPREPVAGARRALGQARQRLRQRRCPDSECRSGRSVRNAISLNSSDTHCEGQPPRRHPRADQSRESVVRDHERERPVGRVRAAAGDGNPLGFVGVEQRRPRAAGDDEGQLPAEVVRVLEARVHALRADRAVDVRRVAQQEAAAGRESARRGDDGCGRWRTNCSPGSTSPSRLLLDRGDHVVERRDPSRPRSAGGHDADDAPVIGVRASGRRDGIRSRHRYTLSSSGTIVPGHLACRRRRTRARTARPGTRCR